MAFLNLVVVEAARVVVRQATETALTAAISSTAALSLDTLTVSATSSPTTTAIPSVPPPSSTTDTNTVVNGGGNGGNNGGGGGGGSNSSSLLFFVALGFGVVFTNLW